MGLTQAQNVKISQELCELCLAAHLQTHTFSFFVFNNSALLLLKSLYSSPNDSIMSGASALH